MSPSTNNWRERRPEHRFNAEIVLDITTWTQNVTTHHKLWNITSFERYIIHIEMLVECGFQELLTVYMSNMVGVFYEAGFAYPLWENHRNHWQALSHRNLLRAIPTYQVMNKITTAQSALSMSEGDWSLFTYAISNYSCWWNVVSKTYWLYIWVTWWVSSTRQDLLTLRGHLCSTQVFGGVRVALFFSV
jgi:hypothetical protein